MSNLIPITTCSFNGVSTESVLARDLHSILKSKREFATWIKNRITKWRFKEDQDFLTILSKSPSGRPRREYYLTIDMAKMLSMAENSEAGDTARRYFIECERKLKEKSQSEVQNCISMDGRYLTTIENGCIVALTPIQSGAFVVPPEKFAQCIHEAGMITTKSLVHIIAVCSKKLDKRIQ